MKLTEFLENISAIGPNLHQTHLEDEVLDYGKEGMTYISNMLQSIASEGITDKFNITVKFDGSPALIFGILPSDVITSNGVSMSKGDFFVGTKSVFNAKPKIAPTAEATGILYGGQLGEIMSFAFTYLKNIHQGTAIYQGDLMFAETGDRKKVIQMIDDVDYITFKPNTIIYTIPVESSEGQRINNSDLGIVVHTKYTGESLENMQISFNVSETDFKKVSNVWCVDAKRKNLAGGPLLKEEDAKRVDGMGRFIADNAHKIDDIFFDDIKRFNPNYLFATFINTRIRNGNEKIIDVPEDFMTEFKTWLVNRSNKEKLAIKTDAGKEKKEMVLKANLDIIDNNYKNFIQLLKVYKVILKAKSMIISALNNATQDLQTFLHTTNGLAKTNPEGFCIINTNDKISKLVDRLEFSKANFRKDVI